MVTEASFKSIRSNPLLTRAQVQQVVRDLFEPLVSHFIPGRAGVKLGEFGATSSMRQSYLEGFSRPLWGLVPLAAGGGDFDRWDLYREGLINGSNPDHPEYWGRDWGHPQQMHVEMAAIGLALALVPERVWDPLPTVAKRNLAAWLGQIYEAALGYTNWQFFRVLVHLGLSRVGAALAPGPVEESLDHLESYYIDDGWYRDGDGRACDYYGPFAIHFYGLIYAKLAGDRDPERSDRFRKRSALFAREFISWFAGDGEALPFGRSLTYRFGEGAFWGALAFADVEGLPWGVIKGVAMRHLRWWLRQPIFSASGILTVGYAYENLSMSEPYNSPGSPYWAMKFFLPLALPETHPFWSAEEEPLPATPKVVVQKAAGLVFCRDEGHVVALATAQSTEWMHYGSWMRHAPAKYCKFAYSTLFGFSVPAGDIGLAHGAYDSMLALSEEGEYWRARIRNVEARIEGGVLFARWLPWPDVEIETWLIPAWPWHVRVHRIKTGRTLLTAEGGFATSEMDEVIDAGRKFEVGPAFARSFAPPLASGIRDLTGGREGEMNIPLPNTNLLFAKSAIPMLRGTITPGEHELICAVLGTTADIFEDAWGQPPRIRGGSAGMFICDAASGDEFFVVPDKGTLAASA